MRRARARRASRAATRSVAAMPARLVVRRHHDRERRSSHWRAVYSAASSRLPASMSAAACRICQGELEPFRAGPRRRSRRPADFAPSNHRPGEHGALFRCATCGAVQQPGPARRATSCTTSTARCRDDAYLARGGRAGARPRGGVLDLIGRHVPAGRLLDVGCGHGLLLDEARRLRLRRARAGALAHRRRLRARRARARRSPRSRSRRSPRATAERFDVIVLADVIEHLDDPAAALDACAGAARRRRRAVRRSRPTRRRRWPRARRRALVGLRPRAHLPAPAAARCASCSARARARDLRRRRARALVRAALLARRARPSAAAAPAARCAALAATPLGGRRVSLVARRRARRARAPRRRSCSRREPLADRPRRAAARHRRAARLPRREHDPGGRAARCRSTPSTARCSSTTRAPTTTPEVALREGFELLRLPANRGYGGNQKAGYVRALLDGADIVVMVHADNQYDPALVERMVRPIEAGHRRRRDGLAPARGRDDRRRHAALEVGRQPRADRGREPRVPARVLRVPHRLPRLLGRLPAPRRVPAQLRRLRVRPGDVRPDRREPAATWSSCRSRRATSSRRRACRSARRCATGVKTLWVLVRFRLHQRGRRWPVLEPPAAAARRAERARRRGGRVSAERARRRRDRRPQHARAGGRQGRRARRRRRVDRGHDALPRRRRLRPLRARARAAADARRARGRRARRRSSCARAAATPERHRRAGRQRARDAARARRRRRRAGRGWRAGCRPTGPDVAHRGADRRPCRSRSGIVSSSLAAVFQVRLQMGRGGARRRGRPRRRASRALLAVVAADLGFEAVVASTAVGAAVTLAITVAFALPARARAARGRPRRVARARRRGGPARPHARRRRALLPRRHVHPRRSRARPPRSATTRSPTGSTSCSPLLPAIVMTSVFPLLSRQLAERPRRGGAHAARHRAGVRGRSACRSPPAGW